MPILKYHEISAIPEAEPESFAAVLEKVRVRARRQSLRELERMQRDFDDIARDTVKIEIPVEDQRRYIATGETQAVDRFINALLKLSDAPDA